MTDDMRGRVTDDMPRLSFRVPARTLARLDALARERGVTRTRLMRQALERLVDGVGSASPDLPDEQELLDLLAEKARQGNVAAIRSLLARGEMTDPRARAVALFRELALERQP
jgi:ribbon-helix-helix CopG family protein